MNKILISLSLVLVCMACSEEKLFPDSPVDEAEYVDAVLSIGIEKEIQGTAELLSRAVDDPEDVAKTKIIDLLVMQFNGATDDAILMGVPQRFVLGKDYQSNEELSKLTVKLASSGNRTTLVVIANVGENLAFSQGSALGEMKKRFRKVENERDLFSRLPDDPDDHIMFNCIQELDHIYSGTEISCKLQHNLARVNFALKVKNSIGMTINKVLVANVPDKLYYINNYPTFTNLSNNEGFMEFELPLTEGSTDEDNSDYTDYTYTFYTTPNLQGTNGSTNEQGKNLFAPPGGTYLMVEATLSQGNGAEEGSDRSYTFYLGENLINDFNIKPNHSYDYRVQFDAPGDPDVDNRVETWGTVDFSTWERANCYILNPAKSADRKFKIPVDRVDLFWGNNGYEDTDNYCLKTSTRWQIDLLWTDFDNTEGKFKITKSNGHGKGDVFEVEVAPGLCGNALVGIRLDNADSPVLWSWHLWITDYNPYRATLYKAQQDVFEYGVTGGSVNRYASEGWKTGIFSNTFIMDREIGATPNPEFRQFNTSKFVYQFGRKDPFPAKDDGSLSLYDKYNDKITIKSLLKSAETGDNDNMITDAVKNPTFFYTKSSNSWTHNTKYNTPVSTQSLWLDPLVYKNNNIVALDKKSIFDPSPPGWCIPPTTAVWDFKNMNWGSDYLAKGFDSAPMLGNEYAIYSYWPAGYTPVFSGHITFHAYAHRTSSGYSDPTQNRMWVGSKNSVTTAHVIYYSRRTTNSDFINDVNIGNTHHQALGAHIRPVMMRTLSP